MRPALLVALVTLAGCSRPASLSTTTAASASASPPAAPAPPAASSAASPGGSLDDLLGSLPREAPAHEATLAHEGYRELLGPVIDLVRGRFAKTPDEQVRLQAVPVQGEARAIFAYAPGGQGRPLLMTFSGQHSLGWFKERPVDDLDPGMSLFALCPGPGGDLLLFFHDPPTGSLAARRWDQAGGLLADFRLDTAEHLDALGALYWPERGWLVAYAGGGSLKAQLFSERTKLAWGREGRVLAQSGVQAGQVRLILDTAVSALLVWPGQGSTGRHHLALRVDVEGNPLWRAPVDLGDADEAGAPRLSRISIGTIRAQLPGKTAPYTVDITAEGRVLIQ